jgi:Xaa-Pro aminopeptidase
LDRRRAALHGVLEAHDATHLVLCGANRFGSAVQWLTGWPVSREAMVLVEPGEADVLLVQFYNHVPAATRIASNAEVRWGGPSTAETMAELLRRRGARRVATIGPVSVRWHEALAAAAPVVAADGDYTRLRTIKSTEEIEFLRVGARMSDAAMDALHRAARPGVTERELGAAVEAAYLGDGGVNHVHYFGATPMDDPSVCVPSQYPSTRRLRAGDALSAEISASFWDHPGQVLRTFSVEAEPTSLYSELHEVADAAFDAIFEVLRPGATCDEVVEAAMVIDDAGFTIYDDLLHGFGGGYLPPILGTRNRTIEEPPNLDFEAGMTVVIQPNVITPDERAGVQTGELVWITERGAERLHSFPRGLGRAPRGG